MTEKEKDEFWVVKILNKDLSRSVGINQRALARLFEIFEERAPAGWDFAITVSILEIYNENLYVRACMSE